MGNVKIKRMKIIRIINTNVVQDRLSENYLTRKFITRNIFDMKYSQFMVLLFSEFDISLDSWWRSCKCNAHKQLTTKVQGEYIPCVVEVMNSA